MYLDETVPLLEYYANREWMFAVDGAQPPDAVHQEIVARLHKLAAFASEAGANRAHSPPLSIYSAPGGLPQDPGHAA